MVCPACEGSNFGIVMCIQLGLGMFLLSGALLVRRYSEVCAVAQLLTPLPSEAVRYLHIKGLGSL